VITALGIVITLMQMQRRSQNTEASN